jgi:hypothetical protein
MWLIPFHLGRLLHTDDLQQAQICIGRTIDNDKPHSVVLTL